MRGARNNPRNSQVLVQIANPSGAPIRSGQSAKGVTYKVTVQLLQATSDIKELGCVDKRNSSLKYFPSALGEEEPTPGKFCKYSACFYYSVHSWYLYTAMTSCFSQWINMRGKKIKYFGCVFISVWAHLNTTWITIIFLSWAQYQVGRLCFTSSQSDN